MTLWETKAHKVVSELCFAAWDAANPKRKGLRPRKSRPYQVPDLARQLTTALGLHDPAECEREVKALMLHHNYLTHTSGRD
jgi:hypothetical protein